MGKDPSGAVVTVPCDMSSVTDEQKRRIAEASSRAINRRGVAMSDKVELKQVLDLLDTWIGQQTSVSLFKVSYREETGALVTIEIKRGASDSGSEGA